MDKRIIWLYREILKKNRVFKTDDSKFRDKTKYVIKFETVNLHNGDFWWCPIFDLSEPAELWYQNPQGRWPESGNWEHKPILPLYQ